MTQRTPPGGTAASATKNGPMPGAGKRVLSFFTGAGGLDLGFEQAGFETVYATDHDPDSCETLRLNAGKHLNPNIIIECTDILGIEPSFLPEDIDLVIGGPPCQSFSASGRRAGGAAGRLDQRGNLFQAYCRIIAKVQPKAFVFENVRGILGTNKGEDWRAIVAEFGKLGYSISYRILDALDYGAPQQRERMFLVGHKLGREFLFPEPTHGPDSLTGQPHISAGEALHGVKQTEKLDDLRLDNGKYSHLLAEVPPGQNYLYFTAKRGHARPVFAYRSRFSDFLYKASPDLPIKTLIASPGKYTGPLHWDNRYFSISEYKRLQGFPDDYVVSGKRADIIRQIGNSVSPKIAYQLALAIAAQLWDQPSTVRLLDTSKVLSFDKRKGAKARSTRDMHTAVADNKSANKSAFFKPIKFVTRVEPCELSLGKKNVSATVDLEGANLRVDADGSGQLFARMTLLIDQALPNKAKAPSPLQLSVEAYGATPGTAQLMWNAVDDWVRRTSNFHSVFELYGHFTEPHPLFRVVKFEIFSNHPVALFAKHAANFKNCSTYFPKKQLVDLFSRAVGSSDFGKIATYLRSFRFDIRSKETNIAIREGYYMVAYPFNLPARRQMNFRVRELDAALFSEAI
jgi:DNA (cytosine-5)-methyltransferase 1